MIGKYVYIKGSKIYDRRTKKQLLEIGSYYCKSCNWTGFTEENECPFCGEIYPVKVKTKKELIKAAKYIDEYIEKYGHY